MNRWVGWQRARTILLLTQSGSVQQMFVVTRKADWPRNGRKNRHRATGVENAVQQQTDYQQFAYQIETVVPQEGFEPPTPSLRMMCSTS